MRKFAITCAIAAGMLSLAGCGGSKQNQTPNEAQKAAPAATPQAAESGGDAAAKALEAMTKGFGQADSPGQAPVEPVSISTLQTVLPDVSGWSRGKPTGEKMSAPIALSQSEVVYSKDEARITAKVVDTGFRQLFFMPFTMMMAVGYEKQTADGFEKSTMISYVPLGIAVS